MINQTEVNLLDANQSTFIQQVPKSPRTKKLKKGQSGDTVDKSKRKLASGSQMKVCRICLCEEEDDLNELICPCNCAGTMKDIHINCLREWLNSKKLVY